MQVNSWQGTIFVALLLCVVCSGVVSFTAGNLRDLQQENTKLDVQKNLLLSANLISSKNIPKSEVEEAFKNVEVRIVNLKTGEYENDAPNNFDARAAAKDPSQNIVIPPKVDIAKNKYRAKLATVYLIKENGKIASLVLPVSGYGLWSTLYGFLTLETDTRTVKGLGFYEHAETPGLGGEVDNPNWKAQWPGKVVLDDQYHPIISVEKGGNDKGTSSVDALSGATITSRGVQNLIRYWLGDHGYGPFLNQFRNSVVKVKRVLPKSVDRSNFNYE